MAEDSDQATGPRALDPDEACALLRECVTVVAPGETLVVRVPDWWTPQHSHEFMRYFEQAGFPFRMLLVQGEEFAVASAGEPLPEMVKREISRQIGQAAKTAHYSPGARF